MAESRISKVLRKDREIRDARLGFGLAAWLFGLWAILGLPAFFILFLPDYTAWEKFHQITLTVFVIGVAVLAIKRFISLGRLRVDLAKHPEKFASVNVDGPPIINTIIPFILK